MSHPHPQRHHAATKLPNRPSLFPVPSSRSLPHTNPEFLTFRPCTRRIISRVFDFPPQHSSLTLNPFDPPFTWRTWLSQSSHFLSPSFSIPDTSPPATSSSRTSMFGSLNS